MGVRHEICNVQKFPGFNRADSSSFFSWPTCTTLSATRFKSAVIDSASSPGLLQSLCALKTRSREFWRAPFVIFAHKNLINRQERGRENKWIGVGTTQ